MVSVPRILKHLIRRRDERAYQESAPWRKKRATSFSRPQQPYLAGSHLTRLTLFMAKRIEMRLDYFQNPPSDTSYALLGEEVDIPGIGSVVKSETANPPPRWMLAGLGCSGSGCRFVAESTEPMEARLEFAGHRRAYHLGVGVGNEHTIFLYRPDPDYVPLEQPVRLPHKSGPRRR